MNYSNIPIGKKTVSYLKKIHSKHPYLPLRIDYCDEWPIYKNGDIFGTKGDTYICNISPKTPNFSLSNDVSNLLIRIRFKER